jgi:hypothetical protein
MDRQRPLTSAGFFHFGTRPDRKPIETLKSEIDRKQASGRDLSECLLVLPEAFNVVGDYSKAAAEPSIVKSLVTISKDKGIAFVVGLKTRKSLCGGPFNCAYLIDGDLRKRLACKSCQDCAGGYVPKEYSCAVVHRKRIIAALVCLDARKTREDLQDAILCVPAHFTRENPSNILEAWRGKVKALVMANSSDVHPSLIHLRGKTEPESSCDTPPPTPNPHHYNSIRFAQLPD